MSEQDNPENSSPKQNKNEEGESAAKPIEQDQTANAQEEKPSSSTQLPNVITPTVFFQQSQQPPQMYPGQGIPASQGGPPQGYRPFYSQQQQYPYHQAPTAGYRPPHPQYYQHGYPPYYVPPPGAQFDYQKRLQAPEVDQIQSGAQQLFRTHNPSQTQQIVIPNSEICGICEKPGASIKCVSICKKFYHKECAEKMGMKTIHQSESNGSYFIQCENCLLRIQKCRICQKQGYIGQQMVKCHVSSCTYFFHKKCIEREKESKSQTINQPNSPIFICNSHQCTVCNTPFRIDELVLRCIKCVNSFHDSCKEGQKIQQLTSKQFICISHIQEKSQLKAQEVSQQQQQQQLQSQLNQQTSQIPLATDQQEEENDKKSEEDQHKSEEKEDKEQENEKSGQKQDHIEEENKDEEMEEANENKEEEEKEEDPKSPHPQKTEISEEEEKLIQERKNIYKRMRTGLSSSIETGELLQVQRQVEHASFSSNILRSGMSSSIGMVGPPQTTQSFAHWRKVDPSETLVINSNTLSKVNDILQMETKKKLEAENISFKQAEIRWKEEFIKQSEGKSVKRVSKIIKKIQGIEELERREKALLEAKFEEYRRFINGEFDEKVRMRD